MFEKFNLARRVENWINRGWNFDLSGLPDPAEEAVIYRTPTLGNVLDYEILCGRRSETKGIEDCRGRWVVKWGTQVRAPTDPGPCDSIQRYLAKESFGWDIGNNAQLRRIASVGPWLHKATIKLVEDDRLLLTVLEEQGEETPFRSDLYSLDATSLKFESSGKYTGAFTDVGWIPLRVLIAERGDDSAVLYWQMFALWFLLITRGSIVPEHLGRYLPPGEYKF